MHDLVYAYRFLVSKQQISGPVNFCAPQPVRNRELVAVLGEALNRPAFMPAPAFLIKLLLGEFGRSLLNSQRVVPEKLEKSGYRFTYPDIKTAVHEIVNPRQKLSALDSNRTNPKEPEKV
jgi:hypothetical protein